MCGKVANMSPSPAFANAPFTFEEMIERRAAEQRETLSRYQAPKDVEVEEAKVGNVPIRIYRPMQRGYDLPLFTTTRFMTGFFSLLRQKEKLVIDPAEFIHFFPNRPVSE
jgi:hypothetical protein